MFRVAAAHAGHIADIGSVHADQVIVLVIIRPGQLHSPLALAADSMLRQLFSDWRINRVTHPVPDFLGAGGGRGDGELVGETCLGEQVFHDELGHGASTDVAVADEKHTNHNFQLSFSIFKTRKSDCVKAV